MKKRLYTAVGALLAIPLYAAGEPAFFKPESTVPKSYRHTLIMLIAGCGIAGMAGWRWRAPSRESPRCRVLEKIPLSRQGTLFRIEWAGKEYLLADNREALAWLPSAGGSQHGE